MANRPKPIVLIILDGWGCRQQSQYNPIKTVNTPTFDTLFSKYPHTTIAASGKAVGLPEGQIGNSEVGHLHIGSGRKVPQDLTRIDEEIGNGKFFKNQILNTAIETAKTNHGAIHILGLLSPGGVHSHENQILALIDLIAKHQVKTSYLHAFLDGRDVPPKSALSSLQKVTQHYQQAPGGKIASIVGRYYAMDRDKRWDRTEQAYRLLTEGKAPYHAPTAEAALKLAYQRNETDEFVKPTCIHAENESPITINDNDIVIFMNFRADRARQLTQAFTAPHFTEFKRQKTPKLSGFVTLTRYAKHIQTEVAYPKIKLVNTLGEFLANQGFQQLRIAETEKYAHVTYFLNGGIEKPFTNEDRILIPSPKVATYDLQPEMSAIELTDELVKAIESNRYDVIMCNYANPDMVGHTGQIKAAEQAIKIIDNCIKRVYDSLQKVGGEALITADHGNIELMFNEKTKQPHTAHTNNLVPLLYIGRPAHFNRDDGALDDIAPTLLSLMALQPPKEMTGRDLLTLNK